MVVCDSETMEPEERFEVKFPSDARTRFNEIAHGLVDEIKSFGEQEPPQRRNSKIHPVARIQAEDIIGPVVVHQASTDRYGNEIGRCWISNGLKVGLEGPEYERLSQLVRKLAGVKPIRGHVSEKFLLDEVFDWLQARYEGKCDDDLVDYIEKLCSISIKNHEVWIPIYRTYSPYDFVIGEVQFHTISQAILDQWYSRFSEEDLRDPNLASFINRERASMQGSIAACIKVRAERVMASEVAQDAANQAIGLLRFLSPVNFTCQLVSYCMPLGKENILQTRELFIESGRIKGASKRSIEQGPAGWNVDEDFQVWPGLLEALSDLSSRRHSTNFKRDLYGALQLHSGHTVATDIAQKILYVTAAIESILIRDSNEPIQKNLGERLAFVVGDTVKERKEIVAIVDKFYRVRSDLFHHGRVVKTEHLSVVDDFFSKVWFAFLRLIAQSDQYTTKDLLITALEERKLT
jgi:hypothetical protein